MFCFSHCTALHVSANIKETEGISYDQYDFFINGKAGVVGRRNFKFDAYIKGKAIPL